MINLIILLHYLHLFCFSEEETARQKVLQSIPANKMGSPEDLVGAVIYLASNASSYTTGTDLCVDGAYTAI